MYKTTLTVCASKIIQDVTSNAVSIIDVFEEFNAPGLPFVIPGLSLLWTLEREATDPPKLVGHIRILQEQELGIYPVNLDFKGSLRTRSILVIRGLVIGHSSDLKIEFELNEALITTLSLPIKTTPHLALGHGGH